MDIDIILQKQRCINHFRIDQRIDFIRYALYTVRLTVVMLGIFLADGAAASAIDRGTD